MSLTSHLSWMLNPNLSEGDVMRLVEADCRAQEQRTEQFCETVEAILRKHGRDKAVEFFGNNLWLLFR